MILVATGEAIEASVQGANYDGPTVNGRPILTVETVQEWFREAFNVVPSADDAASIARDFNHCEWLVEEWKPQYNEARRNREYVGRMARISKALTVLQVDLQKLYDDTLVAVQSPYNDEGFKAFVVLLDSVKLHEPAFQKFKKGLGREPEKWHNLARNLGKKICDVAKKSGVNRCGLGKPTSPAILVLKRGLDWLDLDEREKVTLDRVHDACRIPRKRKRRGKKN